MKHLLIFVTKECELEMVLCRIEHDGARAIETVYSLALGPCKIDGVVKSAYQTMISVCVCQLLYTEGSQNKKL